MRKRAVAIIMLIAVIMAAFSTVLADSRVFILCDPETPVNVRIKPKMGTKITGQLDFGDWVETDGEEKNGFIHVYAGDAGEGWIHTGYVVDDQPQKVKARASVAATGRVKSYKRIGGKRRNWLEVGDEVKVIAMSEEWAFTSKGYIRTKYLEVWYE
jgi:hypothetical protein